MKEYFSHDYNARNDPRLIKILMKHGLAGIGAYWCIIEMLYSEGGYLLLEDIDTIAFDLRAERIMIESIINDFDLFKSNGKKFWSESALTRLKIRIEKSQKASKSAKSRWDKVNAIAEQTQSDVNADEKKDEPETKPPEPEPLKPPKPKYVYNEFYDNELKLSNNDPKYLKFIGWLFGENIYKRPLKKVLAMQEQVSWKQFNGVIELQNKTQVPIREMLEEMENWLMGKPRKNKTVLGTLRTFVNNKVKK